MKLFWWRTKYSLTAPSRSRYADLRHLLQFFQLQQLLFLLLLILLLCIIFLIFYSNPSRINNMREQQMNTSGVQFVHLLLPHLILPSSLLPPAQMFSNTSAFLPDFLSQCFRFKVMNTNIISCSFWRMFYFCGLLHFSCCTELLLFLL